VIVGDGEGNLLTTTIVETSEENDHLVLELDKAIAGTMNSSTATAYGNVAKATHGETVSETLGSGDAAHPFLTFSLKKSPLTHVPQAGAPHGAGSTLQVRVDGVLWTETPDFYGQEETARIFISRADNEGEVTVTFGDGKTGATPPTGNGNVTAVYRQGIGQVGNVNAGTLTTLLKKPLGLKKAMNPAPAEGGSEPESVEQIRENAPNTVRTFGRVVSLTDFADAAREYAGIAKARADWYWNDLEQVVRLTVAGDAGAVITTGGETHTNLVADLNSRRDPNRGMMVVSHVPVAVTLVVNIQVDVAYIAEDVQASVRTALLDYFAFDNLDLGQPIHLSDLYRVIHTVTGVVAADIDNLNFKLTAGTPSKNHLAIAPNEIATMAEADLVVNLGLRDT
jgi:predicted phage baseplate assembly protein